MLINEIKKLELTEISTTGSIELMKGSKILNLGEWEIKPGYGTIIVHGICRIAYELNDYDPISCTHKYWFGAGIEYCSYNHGSNVEDDAWVLSEFKNISPFNTETNDLLDRMIRKIITKIRKEGSK